MNRSGRDGRSGVRGWSSGPLPLKLFNLPLELAQSPEDRSLLSRFLLADLDLEFALQAALAGFGDVGRRASADFQLIDLPFLGLLEMIQVALSNRLPLSFGLGGQELNSFQARARVDVSIEGDPPFLVEVLLRFDALPSRFEELLKQRIDVVGLRRFGDGGLGGWGRCRSPGGLGILRREARTTRAPPPTDRIPIDRTTQLIIASFLSNMVVRTPWASAIETADNEPAAADRPIAK